MSSRPLDRISASGSSGLARGFPESRCPRDGALPLAENQRPNLGESSGSFRSPHLRVPRRGSAQTSPRRLEADIRGSLCLVAVPVRVRAPYALWTTAVRVPTGSDSAPPRSCCRRINHRRKGPCYGGQPWRGFLIKADIFPEWFLDDLQDGTKVYAAQADAMRAYLNRLSP